MKRRITKIQIINMIKILDTRFKKLSTEELDVIINNGFAELCTVIQPFVGSIITDLKQKYELGETVFDIFIPEDNSDIYDLYLEKESLDKDVFESGSFKNRSKTVIWRDGQDLGIVHVDLTYNKFQTYYDNAVVKYSYIPTADFDELFIGSDVYIALESAIGNSAYEYVHDVEKSGQKRAAMERKARSITNPFPNDISEPGRASMFPYGV